MEPQEITAVVREELERRNLTPFRAARIAGLPENAVRTVLNGHEPRVGRLVAICKSLGLELSVGPRGGASEAQVAVASNVVPGTQVQRPLTMFSWRRMLPVREWGQCSPEGHLSKPTDISEAPAPVDLIDDDAFYGQMMGQSMLREGIGGFGFYCLVSPNTELDVDERVWLRNRDGLEVISRLVDRTADEYFLRAWGPADENGRQECINERWMRADVAAEGVVLAVYSGWPSVKHPPFRVPDVVGPEGQRVIRVPVPDQQLATLLIALVEHYDRLSGRGRDLFSAEIQKHFPVGRGAESQPGLNLPRG